MFCVSNHEARYFHGATVRLDIHMEEILPVPIERVWHALTDASMLERWLMRTQNFEASVGTRFTFHNEPSGDCGAHVECEVLELTPPHRMVWSWLSADDPARTRLVIELERHDQGTRLTLRHTGEADERTLRKTTEGWTSKLRDLARELTPAHTSVDDQGDDDDRSQDRNA
jgi:uncharacterized protein YndB with AHSA1/START domain